ncbi:hypothetical protein [Actinocrinis sp.]|uniref:hypothetical protein n=1 Tax=Actinocrinis sp. TaxID=1920516 RepID=UPI002C08F226|nr:hypothetical protein [Actinocrinis sp.]HXR69137.1 hypothetical protein [Actinocrinis sp.]
MEAEDSEAAGRADRVSTVGADQDAGATAAQAPDAGLRSDPDAGQALETGPEAADDEGAAPDPEEDAESDADCAANLDADLEAEQTAGKGRPVSSGIGCAALLLPLVAVAGAILCFAAGILSTVTGCTPNGSALCSANGAWFEFALPLFVSPIIAAGTAIGAVTVRRHRSTWLAVGYGIVFISIIVGLASASTGSN